MIQKLKDSMGNHKMMKIFITGQPGVGKTTLLKKIYNFCREKSIVVCGFITEEVRENRFRIGFDLITLGDNQRLNFASIYKETPYKFGKYFLDIAALENVMDRIFCIEAEVYIIDEIGKMEFFSERFKEKIHKIMENDKLNIVSSLHRDFVKEFKKYGKVYYLTQDNRDLVFEEVKQEILILKK
ncbi:MAG: NTPase [Dictyoglomus turgidum]